MAMANLLLNPPMMIAQTPKPSMGTTARIIALKSTEQPPSRFKKNTCCFQKSSSYTPPTSSSTHPLSLRLSSKHQGFGAADFWGHLSGWDNVAQTNKKLLCRSSEDRSYVGITEDEADLIKLRDTLRRYSVEQSLKKYAVIVGASFCAVLAIYAFVLEKQRGIVLSRSIKDFFFASPLTQRLSSKSMITFFIVMLNLAHTLINIWHSWYNRKSMQNFVKMRIRKQSKKQSVTLNDVEGLDAAKAELLEIVSCIKGDSEYIKLGEKLPRGVLLAGTVEARWARTVAKEADVAFISMCATDVVEVYGEGYVRDVFWEARKRSPCIIFIDEIDAVGNQLGISFNSERDKILNQLLSEMDGLEKGGKVVVIAATNRPELLDPALTRPGRFSWIVVVGEPGRGGSYGSPCPAFLQVPSFENDVENIVNYPSVLRLW